jgi:hypothetical protein
MMSDTDSSTEIFFELDQEMLKQLALNKRAAIRYRRKDIKATLKLHGLFYPRIIKVVLHDISSKGAGVLSPKKLSKKSKVSLYLLFDDGRRFDIDAVVVYALKSNLYGLKFNKSQSVLAEHLLETQTDLTFS